MKFLLRHLIVALLLVMACGASAESFNSSQYTMYELPGDVYGLKLIYLIPTESTLIIHGDIATPIRFMPNTPAYAILFNADGTIYSTYKLDEKLNVKNIANTCPTCTPSTIKLFDGDFDGNGLSDFAFSRNGRIHVIRFDASTPSVYATIIPPSGSVIASVSDSNGDGRADIVLTGNNGLLASAGNGQFTAESAPLFPNTSLVGAIAGSFRVNEQGAATYNIPIMTFAGTAGVAPQISLNYDSQSGSGIAGVGWSISGLSAISRCRQTESQDGNALPLTFGPTDRFCLDGQRLILTTGSTYGAPSTKYRTEIDSGVEVTAIGGSTGNPSYFEVTRKDGSVSQYGNGANSKQLAGSATLTWSINQFADSVGNPIKFQYFNDANGFRVDRIYYAFGGNKTAATSSTYIAFSYAPRPDPHVSYINAARLANTQRLTKVETFNSGTSLRSYNLQYATALPQIATTNQFVTANKSYLDFLYECVGSTCLRPTKFHWQLKAGSSIDWNQGQPLTLENGADRVASWKPLDYNGDGITDLAVSVADHDPEDGNSIGDMWIFIHQGLPEGGFSTHKAFAKHWSHSNNTTPMQMEVLDYNADGKQDLAYWIAGSTWKILLSKPHPDGGWKLGTGGEAFDIDTGIADSAQFFDLDSDGLADALYQNWLSWPLYPLAINHRRLERNWGQPVSSDRAYGFAAPVGVYNPDSAPDGWSLLAFYGTEDNNGSLAPAFDVNGDGRVDLFTYKEYGGKDKTAHTVNKGSNTLTAITHPNQYSWDALNTQPDSGLPRVVGDINGDGATDWLFASPLDSNTNQWYYAINGKHWGTNYVQLPSMRKKAPPQLIDYNRDGFLDVIWHDIPNNSIKVKLWTPSSESFGDAIHIRTTDGDSKKSHIFLDINGDGALDYIVSSSGKITIHKGYPVNVDAVISRVDNGMGNQTDISYERLSNRSNHYVGMDKRVAYEETHQEVCIYDTQCFNYPIRNVNAAGYYTALNSDWNYDLADIYNGSGLTPLYISKDPAAPVFEFTAPIQIVTQVASSAPTAASANAKSKITYRYSEAKIQAKGRGLLGFRAITTTDEQSGVRTTTRYRQDFPFIGSPLLTEVRTGATSGDIDGKLIKRSVNDYGYKQESGTDSTKRYQVWTRNVFETTYDLNGAETSYVVTNTPQPDSWGNVTATTVSTYSANDHTNYLTRVITSNTYAGGVNGIRYGRLSNSTVIHKRAGEADITKSSSFTYFTTGAATNLLQTETIAAGSDGTPAVTTTYSYDTFGNKSRAVVATIDQPSRQTDWTYSVDGRYLVSTTNALGHVTEQVTLRNAYGSPTRIEGLNGYWSEIEYDSQGRETYRTDATGAWQSTAYSMYGLNGVTGAIYRVTTEVAGGGTSTGYFDVLGRSIATSMIGFDGLTVWSKTEYDSSGRVKRQSEPYRIGVTDYWTVNEYDVIGRLWKQTLPGNNGFNTITYNGLETIYTNPLGQQRIERRNAAGELIEVQDALSGKINNYYTATGQLRRAAVTADGKTIATDMSYDSRGQKTRMFDPDKGTWFYEYNGFGELINQYKVTSTVEFTDTLANLKTNNSRYQRTEMVYDMLGRMTQRSDYKQSNVLEGTATWTYDTATNGVGKLATESGGGLTKHYSYGAYGIADRTDIVEYSGGATAFFATTYDNIGRPKKQLDPLHLNSGTENLYNDYGYLDIVRDLETTLPVYNAEEADARGNITRAILLGGETVQRTYDAATGRLQVIKSSTMTGNGDVQNLNYSWDSVGNMKSRNDLKYAQQQSFCYDALNRLIKSHNNLTGSCSLSLAQQDQEYDGFGNITRKSGVGSYVYSSNMKLRPHAVTNAGGTAYNYDNNGNVINDGTGRIFVYATFDLPTRITKGAQMVEFSYGADRSRWKRVDYDSFGTATTTYYLGNVERVQYDDSTVKYKRTIAGVAIFTYDTNLAITRKQTLFKDALGSVVATRNAVSGALNAMAFNPWGERVMAGDYSDIVDGSQLTPFLSVLNVATTRGFTGHEMVDSMGIVHMNGRIYDARIGRFLQADPFIQYPDDTQSFNRYSYVMNNPLSYTDPSGYFRIELNVKTIVQAVMVVAAGYINPFFGAALAYGFADLNGATSRQAFTAAAIAFAGSILSGPSAPGEISSSGAMVEGSAVTEAAAANATGSTVSPSSVGVSSGLTMEEVIVTAQQQASSFTNAYVGSTITATATPLSTGGKNYTYGQTKIRSFESTGPNQTHMVAACDWLCQQEGRLLDYGVSANLFAQTLEYIDLATMATGTGGVVKGAVGVGIRKYAAQQSVNGLGFTRSQLQHGFKHAKDFGVSGNANNKTLSELSSALQTHVDAPGTRAIQGSYRGSPVTHHVDPSTGVNVIRDSSGHFLSGWKLSPQQLEHVLSTGKLGGG